MLHLLEEMKITDHNVFLLQEISQKKKSKSLFHWFLLVSLHYDVAFSCCVGKLIISNTQTAHILFILFICLVFKIGMSLYFAYTLACWLYIWKPNHQNNEYSTHNNAMSDLWASIKQSIWVNLSIHLYFFKGNCSWQKWDVNFGTTWWARLHLAQQGCHWPPLPFSEPFVRAPLICSPRTVAGFSLGSSSPSPHAVLRHSFVKKRAG